MNPTDITSQLIRDEGRRSSAYQDSRGYWTIGVGTCIDASKGCGLTNDEIDMLLSNRVNLVTAQIKEQWPWSQGLDDARMGVLQNMGYQMGIAGLAEFRQFLAAMEAGDYNKASDEMCDSLWAKQTVSRAMRLAAQVRTGLWQ